MWISLLKPRYFSPVIALVGVLLMMTGKKPRSKSAGGIMVGFAILMYGMTLMSEGLHLDNSLLSKLKRSLAYFCESVQRANVAANEPDIKSQQAFMKVYERHLHGDRDDTPEEWRSYK